jgi:cytochrome oxidase assembly protein ShyY1
MRGRAAITAFVPLLAGVLIVGVTVSLGNWQVRRAHEKADLQARIDRFARTAAVPVGADAQVHEGQAVSLEGRWLAHHTILLDNRTHGGRAGYHVLTPLQLADGSGAVLVNRGWLPVGADRTRLPDISTPDDAQTIAGRMRPVEAAPFALSSELVAGRMWQNLDLDRYRAETGMTLATWTLQQTSAAADGLVREWPAPAAGIDRHRGYALQWYSLAGLAAGLTAWYAWHLIKLRPSDAHDPRPAARR